MARITRLKLEQTSIPHPGETALLRSALGMDGNKSKPGPGKLPFGPFDVTAGVENEFMAAVAGTRKAVDLPRHIEGSSFYQNLLKRTASEESPPRVIEELKRFLRDNPDQIWENSWVMFPKSALSRFAAGVLARDLRSDKQNPDSPLRSDADRFCITASGRSMVRVPVSYLLKLALADAISPENGPTPSVSKMGERALLHFLNDNTSPEIRSFYPVRLSFDQTPGKRIVEESQRRYLLTQALAAFANKKFGLNDLGQQAIIYNAPQTPERQQRLNGIISDAFYRELFMSPCLSGWNDGEGKQCYMGLCHEVLSRSKMNTLPKLREAGIIVNNLVVLPDMSNTCLANNGTHVSLGSRVLTRLMKDGDPRFTAVHEKYYGDLAIKIMEHFLPLFVGTYSAAPRRLDFADFFPEKVLGFLPHELDYTHLRMIWRRWKKKAKLKVLGQPLTPFGPPWLDRTLGRALNLKGDLIPDFRLLDYLVGLMSTHQSPALNGLQGNDIRLKQDLASMGIFDARMALYLPYRLRLYGDMGFSGFEGRYYSLFEDPNHDMGEAVAMQTLINAMAFQYILNDQVHHATIGDDPEMESERRQIFFGAAIGIPTFYVRKNTRNRFLLRILKYAKKIRSSRRYPGYLRCHNLEYRKALIRLLEADGAPLVEALNMKPVLESAKRRLDHPKKYSAAGRLVNGIMDSMGIKDPLKIPADEFNMGAERYFRGALRKRHLSEAFRLLEKDVDRMAKGNGGEELVRVAHQALALQGGLKGLLDMEKRLLSEKADADELVRLIHLLLGSAVLHDAEGEISREKPILPKSTSKLETAVGS